MSPAPLSALPSGRFVPFAHPHKAELREDFSRQLRRRKIRLHVRCGVAILVDMLLALCYIYEERAHPTMKDRRRPDGADLEGEDESTSVGREVFSPRKARKSRSMHTFQRFMIAWS